jgi:glycosyltransferase involved in cell wall biosynthesis
MKIAFYYSFPLQKDWYDGDLEGSGLAGSETALVHISRELALRHEVTVFNRASREGIFNGVRYLSLSRLDYDQPWDVFIAARGPVPDLAAIKARVKVYWSIEEDQSLVEDWGRVLPHVKGVITVSSFHTDELLWRCQVPPELIYESRLGISAGEYATLSPKEDNKLIYCAIPGRGLECLAGILPLIQNEIRNATLVVTSDYTLWGREAGLNRYRELFCRHRGVEFLGCVPRPRLLEEQKTSVLHLHPCTVADLFCLPSIECQAAATPTIATDLGALRSTVQNGYSGLLVPGIPGTARFQDAFANAVIDLLRSPVSLRTMADQARRRALEHFAYGLIVAEWEERLGIWAGVKNA